MNATATYPLPIPRLIERVAGPRCGSVWVNFGEWTRQALSKIDDATVAQWVPWRVTSNNGAYITRMGQFVSITANWPEAYSATKRVSIPLPVDGLVVDKHHTGRIAVGVSDTGKQVSIRLDHNKPHALVGGTTGCGKTETLRTLLASVVRVADWDIVIASGKGVTDVGDMVNLNRLMWPVATTALDVAAVLSAVVEIIHTRNQSITEIPQRPLLVVFDEPQVFTAEHSDIADAMAAIAQLGRSTGVHLVAATQHPNQDSWGNSSTRSQLRSGYVVGLRCTSKIQSRMVTGDNEQPLWNLTGAGDSIVISQAGDAYRTQVYLTPPGYFKRYSGAPQNTAFPAYNGERLAQYVGTPAAPLYSVAEVAALLALREAGITTRDAQRENLGTLGVSMANDRLSGLRARIDAVAAKKAEFSGLLRPSAEEGCTKLPPEGENTSAACGRTDGILWD